MREDQKKHFHDNSKKDKVEFDVEKDGLKITINIHNTLTNANDDSTAAGEVAAQNGGEAAGKDLVSRGGELENVKAGDDIAQKGGEIEENKAGDDLAQRGGRIEENKAGDDLAQRGGRNFGR
ncbi:hypothetical protein [Niallia sp. Krafla_26]|uniref:hypothetical protein n=1 Tax=Niallia sp. Krafla_26 TaxID=3064703 RepID=UPI003D162A60